VLYYEHFSSSLQMIKDNGMN